VSPRRKRSPYRYDRAAIRLVLETQGFEAARSRWPSWAVNPIARLLGLTREYSHGIWDASWTPLLGTKPDSVLAAELGVSKSLVILNRNRLGVPSWERQFRHASVTSATRARLAAIPDSELSTPFGSLRAKYGVAMHELTAERKRRGVVAADPRGRKAWPQAELRRVAVLAIKAAYPDITLEQIGEAVGLTHERVRQLLYVNEAVAS
jgi:hypothetical protein